MTQPHSRIPLWAALLGSGLAGALVATQTRINGGLSQEIGNGFVVSVVSFGSGLLIMCIVLLFSVRGRRGITRVRAEAKSGHLPVWVLGGGAFGAFFVLMQGLVAPVLGMALFAVGILAGQVLGGLLLDKVGLGPGGKLATSPARVLGTLLAIAAVAVSMFSDLAEPAEMLSKLWLVLIPVVIGVGVATQSAVNGLVRAAAQSAVTSTFVNFVVGTAILVVIALVSVLTQGMPTSWPTQPWFYLGGAVGTIFIAIAAMLVRTAGVLLLSLSNVAGQLIASVLYEAGLPLADGVTPWMLAGAAVALLAVVVAALPGRSGVG